MQGKQHRLSLLSLMGSGVWGIEDDEVLQHGARECSRTLQPHSSGGWPLERPIPSDCCVWGHWDPLATGTGVMLNSCPEGQMDGCTDTQTAPGSSAAAPVCPRLLTSLGSAGMEPLAQPSLHPLSPQPIPGLVTTSLVALDSSAWDRSPFGAAHPLPAAWDPLCIPLSLRALFQGSCWPWMFAGGSAGSGSWLESYTTIHPSLYKIIPVLGLPLSLIPFCSALCVGGSSPLSSQGIFCRNHQPLL